MGVFCSHITVLGIKMSGRAMTDYIPTYEEAKNWYGHEAETLELEFDCFIRKVKAEAWDEAPGTPL